jgi:glycosidase
VIYLLMVDRFSNGDPANDGGLAPENFHGGDLQGVIDHLDELQALGVRTLWLTPVWKMRTEPFFGHGAFHGYWTEDLGRIEPRFGDEATLRRLADEARRRGMGLMLDMVYNHVAPDGAWTREHSGWFHPALPVEDWNDPVQVQTHEVHGLPDLDQDVPEVFDTLLAATRHWIEVAHPTHLRLDAVRHMRPDFVRRLGDALRADGDAPKLVGEVFDGDPVHVAAIVREAKLDGVFDFPLHYALVDVACRGASPLAIEAITSLDRLYPAGTELIPFLDNHDTPRILSECGNRRRVRRALRLLGRARGTPMLTWGTEVPLAGAGEPENRADMDFDNQRLRGLIRRVARSRRVTTTAAVATVTLRLDLDAPATAGELRLVGSYPEVGAWDPARGIVLPAQLELPEGVVAYKLVRRAPDGGWTWMDGANRHLRVRAGARVRLRWE